MVKKLTRCVALAVTANFLVSCGGSQTETDTNPPPVASSSPQTENSASPQAENSASPQMETSTGSLGDPKSSIAYQLDLIKAGDADKLKTCLTPRVRDDATPEIVDKAKADAPKYTMDDLYASAEMGEAEGKKTAKVKMKNGRTLTTLVETDGQWLADTIWFK